MNHKWKDNAESPVLLFVDDLCLSWVDANGDGKIQPEEDFGLAAFSGNGAFHYFDTHILRMFPDLKATFFLIVGERSKIIKNSQIFSQSYTIKDLDDKKEFLFSIHEHQKYELAYHGITHGLAGNKRDEYVYEWESFNDMKTAFLKVKEGRNIFKEVLGKFPSGGKYCGYKSNAYSDESIIKNDFSWWCRYDNRAAVNGSPISNYSGEDSNPLTAFNIKFFGNGKVVDIPTTVYSNLFNYVYKDPGGVKGLVKKKIRSFLIKRIKKEIDFLLKHNLVISIQTHISPAREDGRRQALNIFDDRESLITIFDYLRSKNVWYCTAGELADWVNARSK